MAPKSKEGLLDLAKWLLIPTLTAIVTATYAVGSFRSDFKALENKIGADRSYAEQNLSNAIAMRRADQALLQQKDSELERSLIVMQTAQKEVISIMQGLAKDNASFREEAIRRLTMLDERMGYLAKNVEELKQRR